MDKSLNSYSIDIPMKDNCDCCGYRALGFETDYPPQLQSVINPNDFEQSITNINRHYPKCLDGYLYCVTMFGGFALALLILGSFLVALGLMGEGGDIKLVITMGSVLCVIGVLICLCSYYCCQKRRKRTQALHTVVEEESLKYEAKHCQWRLKMKKDTGFLTSSTAMPKYHVIIDINQTNESV